jgi:hypothetical protein
MNPQRDVLVLGFLTALLIAAVLFLASCASGTRLTDAQAKEIAQAKANLEAARAMEQFVTALGDAGVVIRDRLYQAAAHRFDAATANVELPAPATPAAALVGPAGPNEPVITKEAEDAKVSAGNPPPSQWGMIGGIAGGVGLAALGLLRFSPGVFGGVAQLAHTFLAPKATREMRAVEKQSVAVAQQAVAYGHAVTQVAKQAGMESEVERVKDAFGKAQDQLGVREQIDAILSAYKAGKLPVKPQDEHA